MTKYLVNTETAIQNIADAIRAKTGSTDNLTVANMPEAISNISGGGGGNFLSINIDDYSNVKLYSWPYSTEDEDYINFTNSNIVIISSTIIVRNQNLCNTIESHLTAEPNFSNISMDPVSNNVYMPHSLCLYKFNSDENNENNIIIDEFLAIPKSLRYGDFQADAGGTPIGDSYHCKMIDMINIKYDYHLQYNNNEYINTIYYDGERSDYPNRYASGDTIILAPNWNGPTINE